MGIVEMILYRMITGPDDSSFCHRVSKALSNGWELAGSASLTFNVASNEVVCGQAIVKNIADRDYDEGLELGDY